VVNRPIVLLTDFGLRDYYVGAVKAVIYSVNPDARIIDLSHDVSPWNVLEGAFLLWLAVPYLPSEAVVVGVVDPGVGGARENIVIRSRRLLFVGPNNGLLYKAAERDGIVDVRVIANEELFFRERSTFDGRDVFAPIAARLSMGLDYREVGPPLPMERLKRLEWPRPRLGEEAVEAVVLHVDRFGNCITNVYCREFDEWRRGETEFALEAGGRRVRVRRVRAYEELGREELGLVCGGTGFIEVAAYLDMASARLGLRPGDRLRILRPSP